ncbi:MAG: hypothetical protein EP330_24800 [Deltaproteobacteria bacterium]|nr:MAG: hypothetical protein EP330_24800 [Deltaproteobacteria bacterium]
MVPRSYAISLGAGLLLSACTGDEPVDDSGEDTGTEPGDTGDTGDTGESPTDVELLGSWEVRATSYTTADGTETYTFPYSFEANGYTYTYSASLLAESDMRGVLGFTESYDINGKTGSYTYESPFTWTRLASRSFSIAFDAGDFAALTCDIDAADDDAMICAGVDDQQTEVTLELVRP